MRVIATTAPGFAALNPGYLNPGYLTGPPPPGYAVPRSRRRELTSRDAKSLAAWSRWRPRTCCSRRLPIEPVAWSAPAAPGYVGPHAPNTRLASLQRARLGARDRAGARRARAGRQALCRGGLRRDRAHERRRHGARGLGEHRRPRARLRFRRRRPHDRSRCVPRPAGDRPRRPDRGARRPGRRRPDPLRGCGRRREERQDLLHRRLAPLRRESLGRHVRGERARRAGAFGDRPGARVRPGHAAHARVDAATCASPTASRCPRRAHAVRRRDLRLPRVGDRRRGRRAEREDRRAGTPQARVLLANLPGLPGQPDARRERPHLARVHQAAQRRHRPARGQPVPAQGHAAAAEGAVADTAGLWPRDRIRSKPGPSSRICRIRRGPTPRRRASPKPATGSTCRACTRRRWGGCPRRRRGCDGP